MGCELVMLRDFDNGDKDFTDEEVKAAADATRLCLAAPALLAALEAMVQTFLDGSHYETVNPSLRPCVVEARAAIAKAVNRD